MILFDAEWYQGYKTINLISLNGNKHYNLLDYVFYRIEKVHHKEISASELHDVISPIFSVIVIQCLPEVKTTTFLVSLANLPVRQIG